MGQKAKPKKKKVIKVRAKRAKDKKGSTGHPSDLDELRALIEIFQQDHLLWRPLVHFLKERGWVSRHIGAIITGALMSNRSTHFEYKQMFDPYGIGEDGTYSIGKIEFVMPAELELRDIIYQSVTSGRPGNLTPIPRGLYPGLPKFFEGHKEEAEEDEIVPGKRTRLKRPV